MTAKKLLAREDLLGGLGGRTAKQASTLLAVIESHTAYLTVQAQQAMVEFQTEASIQERNRLFLEAIAAQRASPVVPTIQALERWAPQWAQLVPENPSLRAALAHLFGQKYTFTRWATPRLRAALGLDQAAVQEAYQRLYAAPLEAIFTPQIRLAERLRWLWAGFSGWLDELPPFWTAFALTLTNTVGSSVLALPIALAGIGPLAGVVVLLVLGLVNVLTIAFLAETFTRTGSIRYGKSFIGRVIADYLGNGSAVILSVGAFLYCVLSLFAYYIGFSTTLAATTSLPAPLWAGLLFLVGLYFLRRESLSATVASALVTGAINIGLILILSLLAFRQAQPANLLYVKLPWLNGEPFEPAILRLVLGVVLGVYSGHLSVSNCAQVVLRRDPSGRALMRGATSALLTAILLFCIWVAAVNGAIAPTQLAQETGTALVPLAREVGPAVHLFGTIYIFLGIGMISIHASLGLFNLTREWFAKASHGFVGLGKQRQFFLLIMPLVAIFVVVEWLLLTGAGSFTQINSLRGALGAPLLAGVFPSLLLVASRRKGEIVPMVVYKWLGHPWLLASIYLLFVSSIFLHGLVFWRDPLRQGVALVVGGLIVGMTIWLVRRGLFVRRMVIEVRQDERQGFDVRLRRERGPTELAQVSVERSAERGKASFTITAGGAPATATIHLGYTEGEQKLAAGQGILPHFAQLRQATFSWFTGAARELKVWVHKLTPEGDSIGLPAQLSFKQADESNAVDLHLVDGQRVLPLNGSAGKLTITFSD